VEIVNVELRCSGDPAEVAVGRMLDNEVGLQVDDLLLVFSSRDALAAVLAQAMLQLGNLPE
jgi:hypothetical protein